MKKLSRKNFLKTAAIGAVSTPLLVQGCAGDAQSGSSPAIQTGKKYRWNLVTTWPPNFPILGEGCSFLAEWVKEMSQGQMEIHVYGGGELVPPLEVFDAVSSGTAEMGHGGSYYWAGKVPAAQFFAAVPFGFNAQQQNAWLISGGGLELWREVYGRFNLIPFLCGNTGAQMGGWFNREINEISDFRGLKMRIPGLGGKVVERIGGTVVGVAGGEIFTNLERGVIDATEWIGPYHDYLMGFHQIAKYYYSPGWHESGTCLELMVNRAKYEQLPSHLQAIIHAASMRANNWVLAQIEAKNSEYLGKMIDEEDIEIRLFSREILDELRSITEVVVQELVESDAEAKKVYESFSAFKNRVSNWANLSEKVFYNNIQS